MNLVSAIIKQTYGRDPIQQPIYASKFYPVAGLGIAGVDLLAVRLNKTDPDDPRATAIALTEEETNLDFDGVLPYDFICTGIETRLHLLPKGRQVAGFSGDADAIWGVAWGAMDDIHNIMLRGLLTLHVNDKPRFEEVAPFINCPPRNNVQIHSLGAAGLANQVNIFWASQPARGKLCEFPEPVELKKGSRIKAMLTMPDGTGPSLDDVWTGSLDPYLRMRLKLQGYQLPN